MPPFRLCLIVLMIIEFNNTFGSLHSRLQKINKNTNKTSVEQLISESNDKLFQNYRVELNKLIIQDNFINQVRFNKRKNTADLSFNISNKLLKLMHNLGLDSLKVSIRKFSKMKNELVINTNVINERIYVKDFVCNQFDQDNIQKCYKLYGKNVISSTTSSQQYNKYFYTISSINFKFHKHGDLIVCASLVNSTNENIFFSNKQMCQDWPLYKHNHYYKPLFIVLMYLVCIFIFVSTVLFNYCCAKHIERGKMRKLVREQRLFKRNKVLMENLSDNMN